MKKNSAEAAFMKRACGVEKAGMEAMKRNRREMPASHRNMVPEEHRKAMAEMKGKKK